MNATEVKTEIWSTYLSKEWEGWLGATRMDTTPAARRTAAAMAAAWSPWVAAVRRRPAASNDK